MFTKLTIDSLTDNTVEKLKVSSIGKSLDNITYESNPQKANFFDLRFNGDQRLISGWKIYRVYDDRLKNGSIVDMYTNQT